MLVILDVSVSFVGLLLSINPYCFTLLQHTLLYFCTRRTLLGPIDTIEEQFDFYHKNTSQLNHG
jgi:hypothetical protein